MKFHGGHRQRWVAYPTEGTRKYRHPVLIGCTVGAKLGAICCGPGWMAVDSYGQQTDLCRAVWTAVDAGGPRLEIYGSEGWGFESSRPRKRNPLWCNVFVSTRHGYPVGSQLATATRLSLSMLNLRRQQFGNTLVLTSIRSRPR